MLTVNLFSSHRKKPTRDILERSFGPLKVRSLMELYEIVGRGETSGSEVYDLVYPKTKRKKRKKRFYGKDLSLPISGLAQGILISIVNLFEQKFF